MKITAAALVLLASCVTHDPPITGTQSLQVDLVAPTDPGSIDTRLPDAARSVTISITAMGPDDQPDLTYTNDVQAYAQFLGTLTPALGSPIPLAAFHVVNGKATNQTLMLPPVFGPTTVWVDDGGDAAPTYASGSSPTLWFRDPTIADISTPTSETSVAALSVAPLDTKNVQVSQSRYGTRGRMVVTSVFSQGYTVADVKCADDAGTPPCVAAAYDYLEIFSYSAPVDQDADFMTEGQVIAGFAGGVTEFDGLTEIGFPQTFVDGKFCTGDSDCDTTMGEKCNLAAFAPKCIIVDPAREPVPAVLDPATWFLPLSDPSGGIINFERNEASPIEIDNAIVCPLDSDYTTFKQWKLDPLGVGGANCSGNNLLNVISSGVIPTDPATLVGMTLHKVVGVLRPINIGSFNVWIIYPRSPADLTP